MKGLLSKFRLKIVERLGGKCVDCGFEADARVLQIMHQDPNQEYRSQNRYGFYYSLLEEGDFSEYYLLCRNCKAIRMFKRKGESGGAAPRLEKAILWQTDLAPDETWIKFSWMEQYKGLKIFVIPSDGQVYLRGENEEPVAESWEQFVSQYGGPTELPKKLVEIIEVRYGR